MIPVDAAHIVEFGEAEAYADLVAAASPAYASQFGIRVHRLGSAFVFTAAAFDIPLFNRVVGLGLKEPATEALVDEAIAHFESLGVNNFAFQMSPQARPAITTQWLSARQLRAPDNWVKMIHTPTSPPEIQTNLQIRQIGPDQAEAFASIAANAFGMPPVIKPWLTPLVGRAAWRIYLAFDANKPVGCGVLFIKDKIGWLGIAGTLPAARGRGAQGAIMAKRIQDAIHLGCQWIVTETGEETLPHRNPSYHNMIRTGFELVYPRPNYIRV